jgi:hypothetical protein
MNQKIEKWLTVCALGSWVASIGAMVAIEVCSSQPLQTASQVSFSESSEQPSQTGSVVDKTLYPGSEQTILGLSHSMHWLDHDFPGNENSDSRFSSLQMTAQNETSVSAKIVARSNR